MPFLVKVRCANGHEQSLIHGSDDRSFVEDFAGLLDGTSDLYLSKPCDDPNSVIGKCGVCKAQLKCEVTDHADGP